MYTRTTPGEPVSSTPPLPEITGPFEVEVTVRWDDLTKRSWQTVLEYSNADTNANAIWFGQGTNTTVLPVGDSWDTCLFFSIHSLIQSCSGPNESSAVGRLDRYSVGQHGRIIIIIIIIIIVVVVVAIQLLLCRSGRHYRAGNGHLEGHCRRHGLFLALQEQCAVELRAGIDRATQCGTLSLMFFCFRLYDYQAGTSTRRRNA
jgi:hypothetical protein